MDRAGAPLARKWHKGPRSGALELCRQCPDRGRKVERTFLVNIMAEKGEHFLHHPDNSPCAFRRALARMRLTPDDADGTISLQDRDSYGLYPDPGD